MPGRYLEKFFEHLEKKVAQYAGVDLNVKRLGTIDRRIPHGEDWDEELSNGISGNKAFILILTPFTGSERTAVRNLLPLRFGAQISGLIQTGRSRACRMFSRSGGFLRRYITRILRRIR
jgi:hypothetical protein